MAGDWIKVEKATARKPEVLRIAEMLEIHPDHAFGLCVRFWMWCDDQLLIGNAVSVTKTSIDALVERSGFADSLVNVGWLRVRDGSLEVPNFDRHLSQSAKQRALTAARVNRHKQQKGNAPSVSDALPREEKRRDSISKKYLEIQERAPPKFLKPTIEEVTAYCRERNNSVDPLTWLAHYEANGWKVGRNPMKDWRAAVRTWEARSGDYKPKPSNVKKSIEDTLKELQNMNLGGNP